MANGLTPVRPVRRTGPTKFALLGGLLLAGGLLAGCRQDMHDAPRYEALEESDFFADKRAMRPIPANTVARGDLRDDDVYYTGKRDGEFVADLPAQVTVDKALLDRGQQRFNIYCAPCHSPLGDGNGTVVQRGYKRPAWPGNAMTRHVDCTFDCVDEIVTGP